MPSEVARAISWRRGGLLHTPRRTPGCMDMGPLPADLHQEPFRPLTRGMDKGEETEPAFTSNGLHQVVPAAE